MKGRIRVIGLPPDAAVPDKMRLQWIHEADVLIGGKRHLRQFRDFKGTKIPILSDIDKVMDAISEARAEGRKVVVLATGDPLWFGIGTTLIHRFGKDQVDISPAVSSVQVALARLGIPMDDAIVFDRHKKTGGNLKKLLYFSTGVILTNGKAGPIRVISDILKQFPKASDWKGYVCQCLGMQDERIDGGSLLELAKRDYLAPNLLIVQNPTPLRPSPSGAAFGRPDRAFAHDKGMITHPEIRAVALSKLELQDARVLWDVGAGSGAVGIEAALLNPAMAVHAVEKNPKRIHLILENRARFGAESLTIHEGNIVNIAPYLPRPDRVFIGGGGRELAGFLGDLYEMLKPGGIMVATTITLESFEILTSFIHSPSLNAEVLHLQVTRLTPFSGYHRMKPDNPITLFKLRKQVQE